MKKYILFSIIFSMLFIGAINASDYKVGDLVSYKGVKFYVMKEGEDYLTLLKATPLTTEEVDTYGNGHVNKNISESQGKALDDGSGFGKVAYYSSDSCYDYNNKNSCKTDYDSSDIKYIVDEWTNQKLGTTDLKSVSVNINGNSKSYTSRLITSNELINDFGYNKRDYNINYYYPTDKTPGFIYMYGTWTMDTFIIKAIITTRLAYFSSYSDSVYSQDFVRPVVNVSKTADIAKLTSLKQITDTDFKTGDILEYKGIEFYVMKDNGNYLTLLKATPLTTEEVDNYGKDHINNNKKKTAYDFGGYGGIVYTSKTDCSNNTCSDYDKSDAKYVVDNWSKSIDGLVKDELGYKARLLTYDELVDPLNYIFINSSRINVRASVTYDDIMVNAVSYWTMTPYYDYPNAVYFVTGGHISGSNYYFHNDSETQNNTQVATIRPVINLSKPKASTNSSDSSSKNKVSVPDTLLKSPIFIVIIGIVLIAIATITVSLILKKKKN